MHVYEVRPRKDKRGVDLISDALPFGRLWYAGLNAAEHAVGYAQHYSRSHSAVIRIYDAAGNVTETHEYPGDFKERDVAIVFTPLSAPPCVDQRVRATAETWSGANGRFRFAH
jgi:hypothetical protein